MTSISVHGDTVYVVVSIRGRGRVAATLVSSRTDALQMTKMQRRSGTDATMRAVTLGGWQPKNGASRASTTTAVSVLLARESEHIEQVLRLDPTEAATLTPDGAVADVLRKSARLLRWCEKVKAARPNHQERTTFAECGSRRPTQVEPPDP